MDRSSCQVNRPLPSGAVVDSSRTVPLGAFVLLAMCLVIGCRSEEYPVRAKFQNQDQFLFSTSARLTVHEIPPDATTPCLDLIRELESGFSFGIEPTYDSGTVPICELRDGGVPIGELPEGPLAFLYATFDQDQNTVLLSGCKEATPSAGQGGVTVELGPDPTYFDRYRMKTPSCSNVEEKCSGTPCIISPDGG